MEMDFFGLFPFCLDKSRYPVVKYSQWNIALNGKSTAKANLQRAGVIGWKPGQGRRGKVRPGANEMPRK